MITTAVQQGPQMLEIQGAPAAIPATGDEFRATFAASVSGAAQKPGSGAAAQSGVASAKQVLLSALTAKTASPAASGAPQGVLEAAGDGLEASAESASLASVETAAGGSLKSAAEEDLSADASRAAADSGGASAALAAIALKAQGTAAAAKLQAAAAAAVAASAGAAKDLAAAQSGESAAARGRKELAVSNKETSAAAAASRATSAAGGSPQAAAVAFPMAQLDTTTVAQPLQTRTPDGGSIAEPGAKPGVLTSVLEASDGANSLHGSPVRPIDGGDVPDAMPTFHPEDEASSLGQGRFAAAVGAAVSQSLSTTASSGAVASADGGTGSAASAALAAEAQTAASERSSAAAARLTAAGAVASEANPKAVAGAVQTQGVSAGTSVGVKASASVETAGAVTQTRAIAEPRPVSSVQTRVVSQPAVSKTSGIVTTDLAGGAGAAKSAAPASADAAAVSGPAVTVAGAVNPAQQPDAVRDAALGAAPLTEASSRAGIAATKDEKSKAVASGSDDTTSNQPAGQSVIGDASSVAGNAAANAAANLAAAANAGGRAAAIPDTAIPAAQAAALVAGVPVHDVAASAVSSGPGRALGAVSAGSIAETGSAAAQIGEPHRTLLATPTTLEVGVQSGTQGWLRIRAEVGGPGEVNASLTAASSGAREALHSQLPALNAFLHSEQIAATATVAVGGHGGAAFGSGGSGSGGLGSGGLGSGGLGSDGSNGSSASLLQGGGAQSGGSQHEAAQPVTSVSEAVRSYDSLGGSSDAAGGLSGGTSLSEESGRWLNVRA